MKRILITLFFALAVQLSSLVAQGVIQFRIDFPGAPPSPAIGIPSGSADLSSGSFHAWFFLGTTSASYGRILEMADGGSLTPIFEFTSVFVDSYQPIPGIPGSGGTYYSYDQTWQVTANQTQSLLAGHWYAEIAFGSDTHLAQIALVPEPSAVALILFGAGVVAAFRFRRSLK